MTIEEQIKFLAKLINQLKEKSLTYDWDPQEGTYVTQGVDLDWKDVDTLRELMGVSR